MSIREVYLSENNVDFIYLDVTDQILRKLNYNLNSTPKYKNTFSISWIITTTVF